MKIKKKINYCNWCSATEKKKENGKTERGKATGEKIRG